MPLQCTQDQVSDELGGMAFPDIVVNITSPIVIGYCIICGRVSKYPETQSFSLAVSQAPFAVPALIRPMVVTHYVALSVSHRGISGCLSVVRNNVIPLICTSVLLLELDAVSHWSSLAEWNVLQNSCSTLQG